MSGMGSRAVAVVTVKHLTSSLTADLAAGMDCCFTMGHVRARMGARGARLSFSQRRRPPGGDAAAA